MQSETEALQIRRQAVVAVVLAVPVQTLFQVLPVLVVPAFSHQ